MKTKLLNYLRAIGAILIIIIWTIAMTLSVGNSKNNKLLCSTNEHSTKN